MPQWEQIADRYTHINFARV